jgi:pimeloyl-ACP methyl ester carboxylesterase
LAFDVTEGGPPGGPPVLLLHGFPQHRGQWDLVTPALWSAGLRTYAMDQRGYAPGARPTEVTDFTMAEFAADALAVLDALATGPAHVVGHDWGALVGWHLAARHPDRLRTLTAVSVPHPAALAAALDEDLDQRKRSAYVKLFRRPGVAERVLQSADGAALRLVLRGVPPERVERYLAPLREPGALTPRLNWYRALDPAEMAHLPPVDLPTTFVWSDRDIAIGRTAARRCAEFVTGDYRFVPVPGASHWLPDEAPDRVAAAVLDRVAAGSPATDTFADLEQGENGEP